MSSDLALNQFENDLEAQIKHAVLTGTHDTALAAYVSVGEAGRWPTEGCVAWVDSKDAPCGRERADGLLCKRHHTVAVKRSCAAVERRQQQAHRIEANRAAHVDEWRAELVRIDRELERRTGTPTTDTAAWGGVAHPALQRMKDRIVSDSNVQRVGSLLTRRDELERLLGHACRGSR